ncbi:hypothetical protein OsI_02009 [Oryza sativa Indica Group]|uniref:Uncharacterized protein n=1 Tax=Oryza sativa subsp. indica TaxID=39946 RepID=A2WQ81_ORYSI|nr:hypothetical protein OsI_02009 [Oryza sativa Indica Group]
MARANDSHSVTIPDGMFPTPHMEDAAAGASSDTKPAAGTNTPTSTPKDDGSKPAAAQDNVLSASANLAQLLPTGSVMAYQALSSSFNNHGECYTSNWWLTVSLVTFLTVFCIFFAFTDSITHKGKVYYGVAMSERLRIFNIEVGDSIADEEGKLIIMPEQGKDLTQEQREVLNQLKKRKLHWLDGVHAFFTAVVFLSVAFSDVGLQKCLFPHAGHDTMELLKNMPLGMSFLSSFVFMIFPTTRHGIGFSDSSTTASSKDASRKVADIYTMTSDQNRRESSNNAASNVANHKNINGNEENANSKPAAQDKVLSASANLAQLLPTGSVMAYQALSPSFNNHGECYTSNWWLTVSLVTFLTVFCIFFAITDTIYYNGKVYYGVAMRGGLKIFNKEDNDPNFYIEPDNKKENENKNGTATELQAVGQQKSPSSSNESEHNGEKKGKLTWLTSIFEKKGGEKVKQDNKLTAEKELKDKLERMKLNWLDGLHAFFTAVVFLSVAFSDVGLQRSSSRTPGSTPWSCSRICRWVCRSLSSFVFMIFPTHSKRHRVLQSHVQR